MENNITVMRYGARVPITGLESVDRQLRLSKKYRNALCEIERRRRDGIARVQHGTRAGASPLDADELLAPLILKIDELEASISEMRKQTKLTHAGGGNPAARASLRDQIAAVKADLAVLRWLRGWSKSRLRLSDDERAAIAMCDGEKMSAWMIHRVKPWWALGVAVHATMNGSAALRLRCEYMIIDETAKYERRQARAVAGLSPGTYLLIEAAADKWRQNPEQPRFMRYDGTGRVGVQVQGGCTVAELEGGQDTRMRLLPATEIDPPVAPTSSRQIARAIAYGVVHFCRAGNMAPRDTYRILQLRVETMGRAPVWASIPIVYHRPLPADGVIVAAWLQRKKIGVRSVYDAQLVVRAAMTPQSHRPTTGTIAVDIGSRDIPSTGETRVAYSLDSSGAHAAMILPLFRLSSATSRGTGRRRIVPDDEKKIDDIKSIRSRHLDEIRDQITAYKVSVGAAASSPHPVPAIEWLRAATDRITSWRSTARIVWLRRQWQHHTGDEKIFSSIEAYIRQDRHLLDWQSREMRRRLGRRRELYRTAAMRLARTYDTIILAARDYRREEWVPEDAPSTRAHESRSIMRGAAPGEFREIIRRSAKKYGTTLIEMPLEGDTAWALDYRVCQRMLASTEVVDVQAAPLASASRSNHYGTDESFHRRRLGTDERIDPLARIDVSG